MAKPNAIEQIYNQLMQVLGGTNPNQYFTMLYPGTMLNAASYAFDTTRAKPEIVAAAESLLVDRLYDVAKVTGAPNGERLSNQYLQALSVLVPKFDPMMPYMKNMLRGYINSPAPADAQVNGQPFAGNLAEYYFALYESWLTVKSSWDTEVQEHRNQLDPEGFLEWFEGHAAGRLAEIDAAFGRLLAVFSPADMQAILGALKSGPGGEIDEAMSIVQDTRLPSPGGGYHLPVELTPNDWFLGLVPDTNPVDLLQAPEFLGLKIGARREALMASIAQVNGLLAQTPSEGKLKAAAESLTKAQTDYTNAQNALLETYAANTATAVEMYLDAETGGTASAGAKSDDDILTDLNTKVGEVDKAGGGDGTAVAKEKSGKALTSADVEKLLDSQRKLIGAQSDLLTSSQALADAGMNLASTQSQSYGELPVFLARLQAQLQSLKALQGQVGASIAAKATAAPAKPLISTGLMAEAMSLVDFVKQPPVAFTDASDAQTQISAKIAAVADTEIKTALAPVDAAITKAAGLSKATVDQVCQAALVTLAQSTGEPASKPSVASQRFMTMQFAFETSQMEADSSQIDSSSQTSFSVDLFFGSASGQSSNSSAVNSKNSFDSETSIEIAFQATKVEVDRGWFNPGLFKLSKDMSRLSTEVISRGSLDLMNAGIDSKALAAQNEAILPAFPAAFVIAKDVTIRFKARESSLSALHSVIDSRSAVGGGFLCFSASSSSASHSDTSSLSSKSEDTVITISMPGPQILGWFMEFTPSDKSDLLTKDSDSEEELDIIRFIQELQEGQAKQALASSTRLNTERLPSLSSHEARPNRRINSLNNGRGTTEDVLS